MDRIEVIFQAANHARAHLPHISSHHLQAGEIVRNLCEQMGMSLVEVPGDDPMLGGSAYARLDIADSDVPENGCLIWVRNDISPVKQTFAVAHELGHFMLHRGEGSPLHLPCDEDEINDQADPGTLRIEDHRVEEYTPRARRELEANAFAAELLAPRAEIRRLFAANPQATPVWLAAHFGISLALAHQRLVDAVLSASVPGSQTVSPHEEALTEAQTGATSASYLLAHLDRSQQEAARASTPALVIAGPGTGKTATLVGRVAHLIVERGMQPERILALTFSNRAAGEMRERLLRHGLPGARIPVMTIHAFAASLLREYASQVPCGPGEPKLTPDFRILDQSDSFLLMEGLLGELPLFHYRSLSNPTAHIHTLLDDFSHARDKLLTPADYLALVEAMPLMSDTSTSVAGDAADTPAEKKGSSAKTMPPPGTFTREQIARARERALAYGVWDRALRQRGLVDFGGLIQRAVELLRAAPQVRAAVRQRYAKVLVDEFQDTNRAAAELLFLAAGEHNQELWVVGDRNQSIYRWRGASPSNLSRLVEHFPTLQVYTLRRCYRSVPAIVHLGSHLAARMAELSPAAHPPIAPIPPPPQHTSRSALPLALQPAALEADRQAPNHPAILHSEFTTAAHEALGLAAAIQKYHQMGLGYSDQAILCRSHSQAYHIAASLATEGIPVRQMGDFFERPEIKDALALIQLAAGPDPQGLLRGDMLLTGLGNGLPGPILATLVRSLATRHAPIPQALCDPAVLASIPGLSEAMQRTLAKLGEAAGKLRRGSPAESSISKGLAEFLLAPGGYAWHLIQISERIITPPAHTEGTLPGVADYRRAQAALAALGELIRLAARFDLRWQQEPEFRERLSRAVAHRQRGTSDAATAAEPGSDTSSTVAAPAVCCFLHYLDALRAADTLIPVPATTEDAVHVLTLHTSKGLEFPVVYLPGLEQGNFPPSPHHREEAAPPGFRELDAPGEREAEERCLFYVGITRARDVVAFTHAASHKKGKKQPSSLLALIEGAGVVHPLLSDGERAALEARAKPLPDPDEEEEDEPEGSGRVPPIADTGKRSYTLRELEQYLECPRQYKYAHSYALTDPARHVLYRFHRAVRRGLSSLRQMRSIWPFPAWTAVEQQLRIDWEAEGPVGHAYDDFYWEHARAILRHEWKKLCEAPHMPTPGAMQIAETIQVQLNRCQVRVTADHVIQIPSGPTPSVTVLSRLHTGRPHKDDADDLRLPLYYLGYQQQHPHSAVRIELVYLGDTLADVSPDLALRLQGDVMDMTTEARKAADAYCKPDRKARSRLDKLDRAAAGIEADQFPPRPNARRCKVCPYFYICPADPEAH